MVFGWLIVCLNVFFPFFFLSPPPPPPVYLVEEFYPREQTQTIIKPRFDPRLCQFLMKIISVNNRVCACARTSAEDDNFPREDGECVYLMILFNLRVLVLVYLSDITLFQVILGLLGISIRSML